MLYPRSVTHKQNRATTHRLAELETSRETPLRCGRARMGAVTTLSAQQFATVRFRPYTMFVAGQSRKHTVRKDVVSRSG